MDWSVNQLECRMTDNQCRMTDNFGCSHNGNGSEWFPSQLNRLN